MIKVTTSSILKIGLVVFSFFVTIPVETLARPLRPDLEVVQLLHNDHGSLKMYLGWDHDSFFDVQEVQFRKKSKEGSMGHGATVDQFLSIRLLTTLAVKKHLISILLLRI